MKIENFSEKFNEVKIIRFDNFPDNRGDLNKIYIKEISKEIMPNVDEVYFSRSKKNVLRGLHSQKKPKEIEKIVICIIGEILDIFIDLRKGSKTFGEYESYSLSENINEGLFIPKGFGHGYKAKSNNSTVLYLQSGNYDPKFEIGINPLSVYKEQVSEDLTVSNRDSKLPILEDFLKL